MTQKMTPLLTAITATLFMQACGGGGGPSTLGPGRTATPPAGSVEPLVSEADTTSTIGGVALLSQSNTITLVSALLPNQTGNLQNFSNGTGSSITLLPDGEGWRDANGNTLVKSTAQTNTYEYSRLLNFTSSTNPAASGPVLLGVVTPSSAFPGSGTIAYQGEAFVDGATVNRTQTFAARGVSTVTATLGSTDRVAVTINGFQNSPPFERIEIDNLILSTGSGTFRDGRVRIFDGQADITNTILGVEHTTDAAGAFFGIDPLVEDRRPDEVGGVFVGDGANGTLSGGFLADLNVP